MSQTQGNFHSTLHLQSTIGVARKKFIGIASQGNLALSRQDRYLTALKPYNKKNT